MKYLKNFDDPIYILSIASDLITKLTIAGAVIGIMVLNLIVMLLNTHIFKPLAWILGLPDAVPGVVQVALGLMVV